MASCEGAYAASDSEGPKLPARMLLIRRGVKQLCLTDTVTVERRSNTQCEIAGARRIYQHLSKAAGVLLCSTAWQGKSLVNQKAIN